MRQPTCPTCVRHPLLGAVLAFVLGSAAHAVPVTVYFEGTIDFVVDEFVNAPIEIGDALHGSYRLDAAEAVPIQNPPGAGTTYAIDPGPAFVSVERVEFDLSSKFVIVGNDRFSVDRWILGGLFAGGVVEGSCSVLFEDDTASILDSESLIVPKGLAGWTSAVFQCFHVDFSEVSFGSELALEGTLNRVFVPEPSTAMLIDLGLIALGIRRRLTTWSEPA